MNDNTDWITQIKKRRMTGAVNTMLDVLEPFGPLGAQVLYVFQPVSGLLGWRSAIGQIAQALEEPDGVAELRRRLNDA